MEGEGRAISVDAVKAGLLVTVATVVQVAIVTWFSLVDGRPDFVLLALVGLALLRGPVFGSAAGFWAGLVLDTATLGTLGLTSLLLTLVGYWVGRLGEATSAHQFQRGRVLVAVLLATAGLTVGSIVVHFLLGEEAPVGALIVRIFLPTLALNLLLAVPAYALCRRLFPASAKPRPEASAYV